MLVANQTTDCYLKTLNLALAKIPLENQEEYLSDIRLFQYLDLDPILPLISSRYSSTGRPSRCPCQLFRMFLFASRHKMNVKDLHKKLMTSPVVRTICGCQTKKDVPAIGTFYHFMKRLVKLNEKTVVHKPFGKKPKKLKRNEKLPDKRPARTAHLAEKLMDGRIDLSRTPERLLQLIFAEIAVRPSIKLGLLNPNLVLSADGTALRTGASSYGRKICDCKRKGIMRCKCDRRYSDPYASIGWDSHLGQWYYGYTAFFLNSYSTSYKKDLPLSVRLVDAKRHDSLTSMLALQDFMEIYPDLKVETFLADSAMDAYPIYSLLNYWNINAVIDLGRTKPEKSNDLTFDKNGAPICPAGFKMYPWGKQTRNMSVRYKYRCPAKVLKSCTCPLETPCSTSGYGRTVHIKASDDLRLYPNISRSSKLWRKLFKQRSASERVIKQVLVDHDLEDMSIRTKHRNFFFTVLACIDIHLKAQISVID
jgi:hypothetical protein